MREVKFIVLLQSLYIISTVLFTVALESLISLKVTVMELSEVAK